MTTVAINVSTASDEQHVIDVILLAFSADPAVRRMFPDPTQYLRNFPKFVKAFGGKAFQHGSAYHIDGFLGAALWLPPDVHPDEEPLAVLIDETVAEQERKDVFAVMEQMASYHPREPHWYLPLIGVDPIQQGKGLGSALMRHALIRCDREKKLAYLESTNEKNVPLYERAGFELIGTIQAGMSPPLYPMVRTPR
jgi:ribosomal protein S18 acetylase RimI-like enzyme